LKVFKKKDCFFLEDFFAGAFIAGFTGKKIKGKLPDDIAKVLSVLRCGGEASYMKQIHSSIVYEVSKPGIYEGDALFTKDKNHPLIVKTADCLPLIFVSEKAGVAGVVHMGWRSAREGILDNIPYDLAAFKVVAGVGLRKCCYRVGEEFLTYRGFDDFLTKENDCIYFDPIGFARSRLMRRGVKGGNFCDIGLCSFCDRRGFPSHRRDATKNRTLTFLACAYNSQDK
jgi:copper oxidase (laccase) domain-containing protein